MNDSVDDDPRTEPLVRDGIMRWVDSRTGEIIDRTDPAKCDHSWRMAFVENGRTLLRCRYCGNIEDITRRG